MWVLPEQTAMAVYVPRVRLLISCVYVAGIFTWLITLTSTLNKWLLFPDTLAYYSPVGKKNIYLNSGLTSTKNYGKTILTKVCSFVLKRIVLVFIVLQPHYYMLT